MLASRLESGLVKAGAATIRKISVHKASQLTAVQRNVRALVTASSIQAVSSNSSKLPADIKSVLFTADEVRDKVAELGQQICKDYKGKKLAIIGVLNGAFIFTADLAREISKELPDVQVDFLRASSYGTASESSGQVAVQTTSDLGRWEEFHILLVEDIIDSGHTLARLGKVLSAAGAQSVKVVALLDKKGRRRVEFFPDYCGWECPNEFVVGYGLDFDERFRCLPYVAALKEEAYAGSGH
ncbi:hypothetical protein OEZ86_004924 [Tetradesmus obliquus]|nr:hypothetical protein OEZ86_004924 [Tetradesmus obliquus]